MASEDFIEKLNRFFFDNITRKYKNIAKVFFFFGLGSFLFGLVFCCLAYYLAPMVRERCISFLWGLVFA